MHFWNELKKIIMYLAMSFFGVYVDVYIWASKQEYLQSILNGVKMVEPTESKWINICSLYQIRNKYEICNTFIYDYTDVNKEYQSFLFLHLSSFKTPEMSEERHISLMRNGVKEDNLDVKEYLFLEKKENGKYICRSHFRMPYTNITIDLVKSRFEFMFIEYVHPNMRSTIEIVVPEGMWMVGNELFTPTFILRSLQHQSVYYYFDLHYKINIIDHEIREITLSSDNYIVLGENGYTISSNLGK